MLSRMYTGGGDVLKAPPGPEDPEPNWGHLQAQVSVGVSRGKLAKQSLLHSFLSHDFLDFLKDFADVLAGMAKRGIFVYQSLGGPQRANVLVQDWSILD